MNLKGEMPSPAPGSNNPRYQHRLGADWKAAWWKKTWVSLQIPSWSWATYVSLEQSRTWAALGRVVPAGGGMIASLSSEEAVAKGMRSLSRSKRWLHLPGDVWAVTERCSTGVHPRYLGIIRDYPPSGSQLSWLLFSWFGWLLLGTALPFHTCLHVQSCHLSVIFWEFLYFKVVILCWGGAEIFQLRSLQVSFRQFTDHSSGCCLQPEISSTLSIVDPLWLQSLCRELTV